DGVYETSYGSLWHFLTRDLGAPFTPVALRNIGGMDDLNAYNVIIVPDGRASRMRREIGDAGTTALKAWVRSGGVLIGFGGAGELAASKDLELSTVATVGADSSLKADTTAPGSGPRLRESAGGRGRLGTHAVRIASTRWGQAPRAGHPARRLAHRAPLGSARSREPSELAPQRCEPKLGRAAVAARFLARAPDAGR